MERYRGAGRLVAWRLSPKNLSESPGKMWKGLAQSFPIRSLSGGPFLGSAGEVGVDTCYATLACSVEKWWERPAVPRIPGEFLRPSQLNRQEEGCAGRECSGCSGVRISGGSVECEL